MNELGRATLARQIWSSRQLYEVMVDFWSNHLNVTNPFDGGWDTRTEYDNTVIRANALGRFSDMLVASARSPAMMRYLDNSGPTSGRSTRTTAGSCSSCTPSGWARSTPRSMCARARTS